MNRTGVTIVAIVAGILLFLPSCASFDSHQEFPNALAVRLVDHEKDNWNPLGVWRRSHSDPPTYIPVGTPKALSLTEKNGTWFVDAADGWRFFVPKGGVPDYPEGVLLGEARKITNTRTAGQNARRNAAKCFFGILLLPGIGYCSGGR